MAIYMKFGSIDGDVHTDGYKNWIELHSFQYGLSRAITSGSGGKAREGSVPSISEIVVTKNNDASSGKLYHNAVAGVFDTKVEIKMTTTTKNKVETYLTYELKECGISSYSLSTGGDRPVESLSLNFTYITVKPTQPDKSGQIKTGDITGYDLLAMKAT